MTDAETVVESWRKVLRHALTDRDGFVAAFAEVTGLVVPAADSPAAVDAQLEAAIARSDSTLSRFADWVAGAICATAESEQRVARALVLLQHGLDEIKSDGLTELSSTLHRQRLALESTFDGFEYEMYRRCIGDESARVQLLAEVSEASAC